MWGFYTVVSSAVLQSRRKGRSMNEVGWDLMSLLLVEMFWLVGTREKRSTKTPKQKIEAGTITQTVRVGQAKTDFWGEKFNKALKKIKCSQKYFYSKQREKMWFLFFLIQKQSCPTKCSKHLLEKLFLCSCLQHWDVCNDYNNNKTEFWREVKKPVRIKTLCVLK